MRRILVTRARDDAERTAEKLRRLGFAPLISPVIEIVPTGAAIPREAFDAALATSARAIALAGESLDELASSPFYVVGAKTAEAAQRRGLRVAATAPDVAGLIDILREGTSPQRFLYLAGRDRRDDLERFLRESGHDVSTTEVYEARPAHALSGEAIEALSRGEIAAVLHYSARSATIFVELARAAASLRGARRRSTPDSLAAPGLLCSARNDEAPPACEGGVAHLALSEDVARVLRHAGCADVRVAQAPDEERLLLALREL